MSEKLAFPLHLTPKRVVQPQQRGLQWSEAHRGKDIMEVATLVLQCERQVAVAHESNITNSPWIVQSGKVLHEWYIPHIEVLLPTLCGHL